MKRALATLAAVLAFSAPAAALIFATPAFAQTVVPVPPPIVLPAPPPGGGTTNSLLFNAMLSVARAQAANPQAAQTASFAYVKAIQQAQIGDLSGARASALEAMLEAGRPALAPNAIATIAPFVAPSAPPMPLTGGNAPAIDADAFLALTRGQLAKCTTAHLPAAQKHYAQAQADFSAQKYEATRLESKAAIDACAQR